MANKITQLRFPTIELSYIEGQEWSDNLIADLGSVTQLGIYALPGTKFRISQLESALDAEFMINGSGLFSMNTKERPINSIRLSKSSYDNAINNNHFIVLDLIYNEIEGVETNV